MGKDNRGKDIGAGYRQRKDGKYEGRYYKDGKSHSIYADTLKECKDKIAKLRVDIQEGNYIANKAITLDKYFYNEYLPAKRKAVKGSTIVNCKMRYENNIQDILGNRQIRKIEKREIKALQDIISRRESKRHAGCITPQGVNASITLLSNILKCAVNDEIIARNPADNIQALKADNKAQESIHRALTIEEQAALMKALVDKWYYNFFRLLLCTGMRCGEAIALTWRDIDYKENVIHISKTESRDEQGKAVIQTPKTKTSKRDIPITYNVKEVLDSQKKLLIDLLGEHILNINQLIFISSRGNMVSVQDPERYLKEACKRIGIERITCHAFRSTFATRAIENGMQPQTLKTILGHSSLSMTMDLYSHVLPNTKQEEMDKIAAAFY